LKLTGIFVTISIYISWNSWLYYSRGMFLFIIQSLQHGFVSEPGQV